jgi:hypothetical protein
MHAMFYLCSITSGSGQQRMGERRESESELGMHVVELPFSRINREAHRAHLLSEGTRHAERFPELLAEILRLFRAVYPLHILTTIACYAMTRTTGPRGVSAKTLIPNIEQHHLELLHALLCTIDRSEWGMEPATPVEIQAAIDAVEALATAFHRRRLLQLSNIKGQEQSFAVGLQEQLRDHTQMVRNWGHFSDMLRIAKEAHAPLDDRFERFHGYSTSDFLTVVNDLIEVHSERLASRFALLKDIFRHRTRKAIVHDFYARYEGVSGDPEVLLASLPKRTSLRDLRGMLRAHADRWLVIEMRIEPGIVAQRLGIPEARVRRIFEAVTIKPGALVGSNAEHLFLDNPAWRKPGLLIDNDFIFLRPQSIISFIWPILRNLCEAAGLKSALEKRRASYLEEAVARAIEAVIPGADIRRNVRWRWQGREYETDLVALIDRVVLIVESKSAVISDGALRGGPKAMRNHVQDVLIDSAEQSARLRDILLAAGKGDEVAAQIARLLDVDANKVEQIVRLSVTLDDFSALASAESELKRAGWLPGAVELPPTMNLAELTTCVDILEGPVFFLHYLTARERIQRKAEIFGYEHDYLGMYLESGLDLPELQSGTHRGMIAGMSAALDNYYISREAGLAATKPRPRIGPYLNSVIRSFEARRPPTWSVMGLALLDALPPGSDAELEPALAALARSVSENWDDPSHQSVMVATGPCRRGLAIFHVFPKALEGDLLERLNAIVDSVMDSEEQATGLLLARMLERWQRPYEIAARLKRIAAEA